MFLWRFKRNRLTKSNELAIVQLIISIGIAAIDTVWALYFDSFGISASTIGFISAFLVFVSFITAFLSTPILQKYDQNKIIMLAMLFGGIAYLAISFTHNFYLFVGMAIVVTALSVFRVNAFDITFRDNTPDKDLNKQEGLYYTLMNLGWLVGPLIAGFFLVELGIASVFTVGSIFILVALGVFIFINLKRVKKKILVPDTNFFKNIWEFFRNKDLPLTFLMSVGLYAWWSIIYIYVPLFIVHKGFSEAYIGIFFAVIVIPMLLLEYPIGKLSQRFGFKLFFSLGYLGLIAICAALFIFRDVYVQVGLLIAAGFFTACIEPLADAFFFKRVSSVEEEKYYPVYASATFMGEFVAKTSIACILLFLPNDFAYLTMAIIFAIFFILALTIKEKDKFGF